MWKLLDVPSSVTPAPVVVPPSIPVVLRFLGGGLPALLGLGRLGDVALVSLFPTGNICGNS